MVEKHTRNGRPRHEAQAGNGATKFDGKEAFGEGLECNAPDCPATRSLDRVMRFYTDPVYQVPDWQPRD